MVLNQVVFHPMRFLLTDIPWILTLGPYQSNEEEDSGDNKNHEDGDIVGNVELHHHVLKVDGVWSGEVTSAETCQVVAWAGGVNVGATWSFDRDGRGGWESDGGGWEWVLLAMTFFNWETNSFPFLCCLVEKVAAPSVYSRQGFGEWRYWGEWTSWLDVQSLIIDFKVWYFSVELFSQFFQETKS